VDEAQRELVNTLFYESLAVTIPTKQPTIPAKI
jgi:hypothetical protein